jgi:hypothetical protein
MSLRSMFSPRDHEASAEPHPGATHVLYFTPPGCPDYAAWYLVPVTDWCGGTLPRDWTFLGEVKAGRDLTEEYCAGFAAEVLGYPVTLDRFDVNHGTGRWSGLQLEPAYWLTSAGGGR